MTAAKPTVRRITSPTTPAISARSKWTSGQIIRLISGGGREETGDETRGVWNKVTQARPEAVAAAARIVIENKKKKIATFVNIANEFEGSAPLTAVALLNKLTARA